MELFFVMTLSRVTKGIEDLTKPGSKGNLG